MLHCSQDPAPCAVFQAQHKPNLPCSNLYSLLFICPSTTHLEFALILAHYSIMYVHTVTLSFTVLSYSLYDKFNAGGAFGMPTQNTITQCVVHLTIDSEVSV